MLSLAQVTVSQAKQGRHAGGFSSNRSEPVLNGKNDDNINKNVI